MISRALEPLVSSRLGLGKVIVLLGARQVGKTTLLHQTLKGDVLWLNADEARVRSLLSNASADSLAPYLAQHKLVVIDEAQRVGDIGLTLKILHEAFGADIQFVATGSSSFDLANKINEPLTGRKWEMDLFPLSVAEMVAHQGLFTEEGFLDSRIVFGWYPEVVSRPDLSADILRELSGSTLYKDVFALSGVRRPDSFERLVKALAYQVGSQVNLTELGSLIGIDKKTVAAYIRLLEQAHIVFRVGSYSRNLRNELKTSTKVYFVDVGVRNAVIDDFSPVGARGDIGPLFENFVVAEAWKSRAATGQPANLWFWRTSAGQEIDLLETNGTAMSATEIKWSPTARVRFPTTFTTAYPDVTTAVITRANVINAFAGRSAVG